MTSSSPSTGFCNTMGTATTMNALTEALGMSLPGSAAIPAPYRDRQQCAWETGRRAVEMVRADRKPSDILTRDAFLNAIRVNSALGGSTNAPHSVLAIARMANPWTLAGEETIIARPDREWEKQGGRQILEGPEFLPGPKGDLFISYSASACWSDDYALGLLRAPPGSDPLDAAAWTKSPEPVFRKSPRNSVYAPGHNGFFTTDAGRDHWLIYHANPGPGMGCTAKRSPRIQRFIWSEDGAPVFGEPVSATAPIGR